MTNGLGLAVIPGAGWTASDICTISREAEDAGFDSIFTTEVNNDALATAQLMGSATRHIRIGTWTANIYLRHPYVCAQGAALIAEATGGRFILGLGVSHQPVNGALAIEMANPAHEIGTYVDAVRCWLNGEGPPTHLPQQRARVPVPVYVAALTSRTVEHASESADGVMPVFWSPDRVARSRVWCARGRARVDRVEPLVVTLGIPTFVGEDVDQQRDIARQHLGLYTFFPFFQHLFRASGFPDEAAQMESGAGPSSLSDALLDSICLLGPIKRCRQRLAAYREAGVDLPILMAPIGVEGARTVIDAFGLDADIQTESAVTGASTA
jgi:alkanesulfonate monooxygenase SsuD/methylene tetrahydromethanopterin reductase-like flavin-dependent oxidoreductase (luciferase family)